MQRGSDAVENCVAICGLNRDKPIHARIDGGFGRLRVAICTGRRIGVPGTRWLRLWRLAGRPLIPSPFPGTVLTEVRGAAAILASSQSRVLSRVLAR